MSADKKVATLAEVPRVLPAAAAGAAMSPYEPKTFDEAMRLATVYASSSLLGEIRSAEAAMLIMATGAELGISATTALRSIHIVKGKPVLSADLLVAMCCKRKDLCEYFVCVESTEEQATYETKRSGFAAPIRNAFSLEDARRAKLSVSDPASNWGKYPRAMLRHRAAAELARQVYPDVVLGFYSDAEEEDLRAEPQLAQAVEVKAEPIVERAAAEEPIEAALERWQAMCAQAVASIDRAPAEKMRREVKARLPVGSAQYELAVGWYKDAIAKLRPGARSKAEPKPAASAAAPAPAPASASPVEAEDAEILGEEEDHD